MSSIEYPNNAITENAPAEEREAVTNITSKEAEKKAHDEALKKVEEILSNATTGTLELRQPFKSDGILIDALHYDFKAVTGVEFADAMDTDPNRRSDSFRITGKQALALFAVAVEKCEEHVDKTDVLRGLSIEDTVPAIQLATLFFKAASQAGNLRTIRD